MIWEDKKEIGAKKDGKEKKGKERKGTARINRKEDKK